jgi:hypothetical protein
MSSTTKKPRPLYLDDQVIVLEAAPAARDANIDILWGEDAAPRATLEGLRRVHGWLGRYIAYLESQKT